MKKCYAFSFGGIPDPVRHPFASRGMVQRTSAILNKQDGFMGIHTSWPNAVVVFDTLNHAKVARNVLRGNGVSCGTYIMNAEVSEDMQNLTIGEPVK